MKKIIVDFDNTFGIYKRDLDDALALIYLLKHKEVDVVAVTTSFGNDSPDVVKKASENLFRDLKINLPLYFYKENAGEKIVEIVNEYKNNISIISLGSLSNIAKAIELDSELPNKIDKFIAMGGITEPLNINGKIMDELNFSVDYKATSKVLSAIKRPIVITGNNCLKFGLKVEEINKFFSQDEDMYSYLKNGASLWFDYHLNDYKIDYVIIWDLITSVYFTSPEIFTKESLFIKIDKTNFKKGFLEKDEDGKEMIFPKLKNIDLYKEKLIEVWKEKLKNNKL